MLTIGVCGRKGGSGKTTIAVHLAAAIAARKRSVALVDCDTQASAMHWGALGMLPMPVHPRPLTEPGRVKAWSAAIREIHADFIVLDSPPHLDAALGAVIGLSDVAVIPCAPSGLDFVATAETVGLVREIRAARGDGAPFICLVPNRVDQRTVSGKQLRGALEGLGELVAPDIHHRMAFADAFNAGQDVGTYAPGSTAHSEMDALATFILKQLQLRTKKGK